VSKVLFISMAAQIIKDSEGVSYLNHHMNRKTIMRFVEASENFTMFLRNSNTVIPNNDVSRYEAFPRDISNLIIGFNPYKPIYNYFNLSEIKKLNTQFEDEIKKADFIIFSSASGYYTDKAVRYCIKYNKPYMLINGGFAFENLWYHQNPFGKIAAFIAEYNCKKNLYRAPYALYVTEHALQSRYPCNGKTLGCSDVEVLSLSDEVLIQRNKRIQLIKERIIIGTAANLNYKLKGQKYVIRALKKLNEINTNFEFEYHLIGGGNADILIKEAKRLGVESQVKIIGRLQHEEVYDWYDNIDIYIQPSFQEGLCRSIIEAMSRACPVISSKAGGNVELCSEDFSFKAGNVKQIVDCINRMSDKSTLTEQAVVSFKKAHKYEKNFLDNKRNAFLKECIQHSQ